MKYLLFCCRKRTTNRKIFIPKLICKYMDIKAVLKEFGLNENDTPRPKGRGIS